MLFIVECMNTWKFILFYVFLALVTTFAYRIIHPGWIAYAKAEKFYKNKKYDEAVDFYIKAIDHGIDSAFLVLPLDNCLKKSIDLNKPAELLGLLISRNSRNIEALNTLADFFARIGSYREAARIYRYIISVFPDDIYAGFELAITLTRLGQYDLAIEEYQKLLGGDI
jgi:tetratricopeptide (TPR) repeat protein